MKTISSILCVLGLAAGSLAQQPGTDASDAAGTAGASGETVGTIVRLSSTAQQQLDASIGNLNALREQIAAEKLPMSQELTAAEEQLAQLRKRHEDVTRLVDAGALEIPTIKAEMKAMEDEQSYVSNLLDQYARGFGAKVDVSELQYCGEAIETAKQATENTTLSPAERFERQIAFTNLTVKRLFDSIGGRRFPGVGVDSQGTVVNGTFAIIGPVAMFLATGGGAAGLVVPQTGSDKPLIRPLEGPMQAGLVSLVQNGEGELPLDPSHGGALKALVQRTNLFHIFEKGGPIMWPLLIASILSLGTVLERVIFLMREKLKRDPKALDQFFAAVERGDTDDAIRISKATQFSVVRAMGYALSHTEESLPGALLYAQSQEMKRFRRGIPVLDTVITLAPLLGLLATVTGMMGSFSLIGGDLSSPGAITGGIAEALIGTAFGLGIAITSLIPFNILNTRMEEAEHEIESASSQLELLVRSQSSPVAAFARASHPGALRPVNA